MTDTNILRLIDANANRSREGLRVVEEIARMLWDDGELTGQCKAMRHEVTQLIDMLSINKEDLLAARQSDDDVGRKTVLDSEKSRDDVRALFISNIKRAQEALRVLEEFTKLDSAEAADGFKALRFRAYGLEKDVLVTKKINGK